MRLQHTRLAAWRVSAAQLVAVVLLIATYLTAGFYTEVRLIERQPAPPLLLEDFRHYERALSATRSAGSAHTPSAKSGWGISSGLTHQKF